MTPDPSRLPRAYWEAVDGVVWRGFASGSQPVDIAAALDHAGPRPGARLLALTELPGDAPDLARREAYACALARLHAVPWTSVYTAPCLLSGSHLYFCC